MSEHICEICDQRLICNWSDTHGVGKCIRCATPYQLIHRDETDQVIDKPPTCLLKSSGKDIARRYHHETGRRVFPSAFDLGFLGGRGTTYSGSTQDDIEAFERWYAENVEES